MDHLEQAKENVNTWVWFGRGQAGFQWQHDTLMNLGSRQEARELTAWWTDHPANPANAAQ